MRQIFDRYPALPYVAPFAVFLAFLAMANNIMPGWTWEYPLRTIVTTAVLATLSRSVISWRCSRPLGSVLLGVLVFVIWVGPDAVWPAYREHWLLQNPLTGHVKSSIAPILRSDMIFISFRVFGTAVTVPIIEELFWRGWLMRYLIAPDFRTIRLGSYAPLAFWATALLFASEHGPYWDVGLVAGILYNWWMVRTGSLADCILAHAVTNACLAVYVLGFQEWRYWM